MMKSIKVECFLAVQAYKKKDDHFNLLRYYLLYSEFLKETVLLRGTLTVSGTKFNFNKKLLKRA